MASCLRETNHWSKIRLSGEFTQYRTSGKRFVVSNRTSMSWYPGRPQLVKPRQGSFYVFGHRGKPIIRKSVARRSGCIGDIGVHFRLSAKTVVRQATATVPILKSTKASKRAAMKTIHAHRGSPARMAAFILRGLSCKYVLCYHAVLRIGSRLGSVATDSYPN